MLRPRDLGDLLRLVAPQLGHRVLDADQVEDPGTGGCDLPRLLQC